jgi:hypothetical protein
MAFHAKGAKFFIILGMVFGLASMLCVAATVVQVARGFFHHAQWWYVLAWLFGDYVCVTAARSYFDTGNRMWRDAIEADRSGDMPPMRGL